MAPSLRARVATTLVRLVFRRRSWGRDERAVAARARRLFGAPRLQQWLCARGLAVESIATASFRGEWLIPRSPVGTVFYLHGGGFTASTPGGHRPITTGLARRGPFRVLAPDYRLAPEHRFPAALEDVLTAYRWLLDSGVEPSRLAVAGDSAGGGLALSLLVSARDAGLPLPACAALLSPWTDLTGSGPSVRGNDGRCAMFRPENIAEFAAMYLADGAAEGPGASPLFARLHGLPPLLLQVASDELLLDDARRVQQAVRSAGGEAELELFEGVFHGWHMTDGLLPEATRALDRVAGFFREQLSPRG
jgi:epsilon-lactone hydrolase